MLILFGLRGVRLRSVGELVYVFYRILVRLYVLSLGKELALTCFKGMLEACTLNIHLPNQNPNPEVNPRALVHGLGFIVFLSR